MAKSTYGELIKWGSLGLGAVITIAGAAWLAGGALGKNLGDGMSKIKLPFSEGVNVTMPNVTFPNITFPDFNITLPSVPSMNLDEKKTEVQNWFNNIMGNTPAAYVGPVVPASSTILASANTNQARKAQLEAGTFWQGGVFVDPAAQGTPAKITESRSADVNGGIWVPDPKVQGGGYYIADNSMYGNAGLPLVSTQKPPNASSIFTPLVQSEADKRVIEAQQKANSLVNQQGWYIKDGSWRQRGVNGY